jgi:hypothetical protein
VSYSLLIQHKHSHQCLQIVVTSKNDSCYINECLIVSTNIIVHHCTLYSIIVANIRYDVYIYFYLLVFFVSILQTRTTTMMDNKKANNITLKFICIQREEGI